MSRRLLAVLVLALGALAACGVPTGGAPTTIAPSQVPYGLAQPTPSAATATTTPASVGKPRIYLVDPAGGLVARGREIAGSTVRERLAALLDSLAAGPTSGEKQDQLATALPPDVKLFVKDIAGSTATIELGGSSDAPSGKASRRAVGQIVLTATSLTEVSSVLLTHDGSPVEAPLPGGEITSAPLTASDYSPLVGAPPS